MARNAVRRGRDAGDQLSDEQIEALGQARNALARDATRLRGIERDYRARLLDEPARLVASAAEQTERSAAVIADMLNRLYSDEVETRSRPVRCDPGEATGLERFQPRQARPELPLPPSRNA